MILILINVQYLLNAVFSFEKDLNDQNHSLRFAPPDKKIPQQNFRLSPTPNTISETLLRHIKHESRGH